MTELDRQRIAFEGWIKQPPFEHSCEKYNPADSWPLTYKNILTELAWEAWKERHYQAIEREQELAEALRNCAHQLMRYGDPRADEALAKIDKENSDGK